MAGRGARRDGREEGISTVEVVILTPVLFLFTLTMVGLALFAQNVSQVQDAASDAARMASLQDSSTAMKSQATAAAAADLNRTCVPSVVFPQFSSLSGQEANVTVLEATVTCTIDVFGVTHTVTESAYAPVDVYGGERP
jgi:Flp pilus assembly protein TadG